jgi:ATP-binding cassette subfamily A (ABC1) protein 3
MIGVVYHLCGFMAAERERGLSSLIEAMGGSKASRMASYQLAFSMIYFIGWVVTSLTIWGGIFKKTSIAIIIIWHITSGYSLTAWSLLLGSVFKKAQLSGISVAVLSLGLGVIAQVSKDAGTGVFAILSLLFPPMNYVFFSISLGRWQGKQLGANMVKAAPAGNSDLPLLAFWVFSLLQALLYPVLAAYSERYLYGAASHSHRRINAEGLEPGNAVELRGFTKRYPPRLLSKWFGKNKETVLAVDDLDLNVLEGQIMVLLGANGSGKTTTLEAIAGMSEVNEGEIRIRTGTAGGIGICPQKNVLWDDMTVEEHVRIWNLIKSPGDDKETLKKLIEDCDLASKRKAKSKTLSGGQKRKLQLAAMLTGGSTVCAIDEVSSGLDPLSRRKIWDIILSVRGSRTILMTSHFLDEADLLADHIAMLSKGHLKCEGSAVELKTQYGGGYRVHAPIDAPEFENVAMRRFYDQTIYNIPDATTANRFIEALEKSGISDYYVAGPTIEDVFLKVAEESIVNRSETAGEKGHVVEDIDPISAANSQSTETVKNGVDLHNGKRIGIFRQTWVMIRKRITILQRGYLPTIAAIVIPIVAAGITMVTFKNFKGVSCSSASQITLGDIKRFNFDPDYNLVVGPQDRFSASRLAGLTDLLLPTGASGGVSNLTNALHYVNTLGDFTQYIHNNFKNVLPGGIFLGSNNATYAFKGNDGFDIRGSLTLQNIVDNLLFPVRSGIATQYMELDMVWPEGQGDTLIFVTYTGLALSAFPAFFALYPTVERLQKVRALHYSNGVRALPLWFAYAIFDFVPVLLISAVCSIIFAAATSGWYGSVGYIFVTFLLYGITSIMLVYCISLIARSQLSAFAFAAGGQAAMFLIYLIVYLSVITYADPQDLDRMLDMVNYVISAISPISCVIHALFVSLNSFSIDCVGEELASFPGAFKLYGSPILYLIVQSILLFSILVLNDSNILKLPRFGLFRSKPHKRDAEDIAFDEKEISDELQRVTSSNDGLRVLHLSKNFKKFQAVDDVTFGVPRGEVFALLGPNGAGKTTTINMIRGDLLPSAGEVFVQNIPVKSRPVAARAHLGVCPQFDAMDRMTVTEHLIFYARIRGVSDVPHNVTTVLRAVGLDEFSHRMAEKLSGGNKRKLSLAIALMGNPAVLLLDEPSSGMDAAAKRVMWRTLEAIVPGRSLVLTTHSMEECSALANRAGILAKRMLALGTTEQLRRKYGDRYLVHVVLSSAPYSAVREMDAVKSWISASFPGAELEPRSFGGQIRFSIPAREEGGQRNTVGKVFKKLEREGREVGLEFWSVDRGTMDMVFLDVVGRARVREEGYDEVKKFEWKTVAKWIFCPWIMLIR